LECRNVFGGKGLGWKIIFVDRVKHLIRCGKTPEKTPEWWDWLAFLSRKRENAKYAGVEQSRIG
jgi:hypothetical protein